MPPILNANAVIQCSHGGTFQFLPSTAPTTMVGGAPVITMADVAIPVTPCPFATAAGPAPCVQLAPAMGGVATMVKANNVPVLLASAVFMTIPAGAGAPVPATVMSPGQTLIQGI